MRFNRPKGQNRTAQAAFAPLRRARILEPVAATQDFGELSRVALRSRGFSSEVVSKKDRPNYRGFLLKSPAGLTVTGGFAEGAGFCCTGGGLAVPMGRFAFSFVITESLKS